MRMGFLSIATALAVLAPAAPADATFPGRSGDIVFCARLPDEPRGIFKIDKDGTDLARVLPKQAWEDIAPAWNVDGTVLAFVSEKTGDRDVWTFSPGSGDPAVNLTQTPDKEEWLPTWSPDGRIAFQVQRPAVGDTIDVMESDGGDRVTAASPGNRIFGVEWAPGGDRIVYGVQDGSSVAIESVRPDGTGPTRWASGLEHVVVYDWRPDGRRVLFQGRAGERLALFEIATAGAHRVRRLTSPRATDSDEHASYSPTGSKVVFVRDSGATDGLWAVRVDGSHEHELRAFRRLRLFGVTWQPL
jgi:Tol biopolymer transport system component